MEYQIYTPTEVKKMRAARVLKNRQPKFPWQNVKVGGAFFVPKGDRKSMPQYNKDVGVKYSGQLITHKETGVVGWLMVRKA
jgi:hypothetical protein